MNIKGSNAVLHNKFLIVPRDAKTLKVIENEVGYAENIVLNRMYDRLCDFQSFFDYIVFGTGSGELSASRTTLFNRLNSKAAVTEEVVRAYPTSKWVRSIRLGTLEFNGNTITEVGISNETTNVNTHAMITDAEGNPLSIEKTSLKIVDIYSTVFIDIPNIDSGLFFASNGWRDYLTGGALITNNTIAVKLTDADDDFYKTGTRTADAVNKRVKISIRIEENDFNKDIRFVDWVGTGLRVVLPRVGIFESKQKNDMNIGVGDGTKTEFTIPNLNIENVVVKVDGALNEDWELIDYNVIKFDNPIASGLPVTASYKSLWIPKDTSNVLDVEMTLQYDDQGTLPTPIAPTPDYSNVQGSKVLVAGTPEYGFYGEVSDLELISGNDLATLLGLTAGTAQNNNAGWLKCVVGGAMLMIAKKTFRHTISWNDINAVNAVWGKIVTIGGNKFIVRLMSTAEWNRFMYPLHVDHPKSAPVWANYSNCDLLVHNSCGNGSHSWTSSPSSSYRVLRGDSGVTDSSANFPTSANYLYGWRPVLEFLA